MANEIIYCGEYVKILQFRLPYFPAGIVLANSRQKVYLFRVANLKDFVALDSDEKQRLLLNLIPPKERDSINGSPSLSFHEGSKNDASTIATIQ